MAKVIKVTIDGVEKEVILKDEYDTDLAAVNTKLTGQIERGNRLEQEKNTFKGQLDAATASITELNNTITSKTTEFDAMKTENETLKSENSSKERMVKITKIFGKHIPDSQLENLMTMDMFRNADLSDDAKTQEFVNTVQGVFPQYFTDQKTGTVQPIVLAPAGGGGNSNANNGSIKNIGDLKGKTKEEINAVWDQLLPDSKGS